MRTFSITWEQGWNPIKWHLLTPCTRWSSSSVEMKLIYIHYTLYTNKTHTPINIYLYRHIKDLKMKPELQHVDCISIPTWKLINGSGQSAVSMIWGASFGSNNNDSKFSTFQWYTKLQGTFCFKWKTSKQTDYITLCLTPAQYKFSF